MAFDIVYVIKAIDQFSTISSKIQKSFNAIEGSQNRVNKAVIRNTALNQKAITTASTLINRNRGVTTSVRQMTGAYRQMDSLLMNQRKTVSSGMSGMKGGRDMSGELEQLHKVTRAHRDINTLLMNRQTKTPGAGMLGMGGADMSRELEQLHKVKRAYRDIDTLLMNIHKHKKIVSPGMLGMGEGIGKGRSNKVFADLDRMKDSVRGMGKVFRDVGGIGVAAYEPMIAPLKKVGDHQDRLTKSWLQSTLVGKGFSSLLTSIRFRLASYAVTLAFTAVRLHGLIELGKEFEEVFFEMKALTGFNADEMKRLESSAVHLAKTLGISIPDVIGGMQKITAKMPQLIVEKDIAGIVAMTKWAGILVTKELSMSEATKSLAITMKQFKLETKDAARIANVFAAVSRFSASEVDQTTRAMIKSGAAANAVGLDLEQLAAIFGVLSMAGITQQTAGVGVNTVLIRMAKAGKEFGKNITLESVFSKIVEETDKIATQQGRITASAKLYGIRQFKVGMFLERNAQLLGEMQERFTGTNIAIEQAAIRLQKYEKTMKSIEAFSTKIGQNIFKAAKPELIKLKGQWTIFLELMNHIFAGPALIAVIIDFTSGLLYVANTLLIYANRVATFMAMIPIIGDPAKVVQLIAEGLLLEKRISDITNVKNLALEELNKLAAQQNAEVNTVKDVGESKGLLKVDINIKDPGQNVSSAKATGTSSLLDTGLNFVFG